MPKQRKKDSKKVPNVIRIFCEGAKTEPYYFKSYIKSSAQATRKRVTEVQNTQKNTPMQLVDEACALIKSPKHLSGDSVWVVYDRESIAKYSDSLHAKAYDKATRNGVKVAISNVCFEYWILLHLSDTSAPFSSYDNLHNGALKAQFRAKSGGKDYDKGQADVFEVVKDAVGLARERAAKLNDRSLREAEAGKERPFQLNPYTNVNELLDAIDGLDEDKKP